MPPALERSHPVPPALPHYPHHPYHHPTAQVTEQGPGQYFCEYDGKTYPAMSRRYVMQAKVADESGETYVQVFNEQVRGRGERVGGTGWVDGWGKKAARERRRRLMCWGHRRGARRVLKY